MGSIFFILKGIGDNIITGVLSILLWFTYIVSIFLFVKGFAGYLFPFIHEFGLKIGWTDRFIKTVKIDSSLTID